MQLLAAGKTLAMQDRVDIRRQHIGDTIALLPCDTKTIGVVASAVEAGTMAGGQRGGFIEEEQFGPAAPAHYLAPPAAELADADQPGRVRPALFQQRLRRGIMDDAAV